METNQPYYDQPYYNQPSPSPDVAAFNSIETSRPPPNDNVIPEVRDLIQYLICICILNYRIESQIAVHEPSPLPAPTLTVPLQPHSTRRKSYSDKPFDQRATTFSGQQSAIPNVSRSHHSLSYFSREKLPKDFMLELRRKLKKLLESRAQYEYRVQERKILSNKIRKKVFTQFLGALSDNFNESLNRSRRPEDLIVVFCSKAHQTLSQPGYESEVLEDHLIVFVDYFIDLLSRKGYYFTHKSLIRRLESYLNTLKKGQKYQQTITHASTNIDAKTFPAAPVQSIKKLIPNPDISFNVEGMPLARFVARLFNVSDGYIQYIIDELSPVATEEAAFDDLVRCKQMLVKSDLHPTYFLNDFTDPAAYAKWKAEETQKLDHDIESLKSAIPSYKNYENKSDSYYTDHYCIYVPRYPMKYYHTLISMCIKEDAANCQDPSEFEFSSESSSLLEKAMMYWRLTSVSESMVLLQEATNYTTKGAISFASLTDHVFTYAMEGLKTSEGNEDNRALHLNEWTTYEKSVAYLTMSNTLELCVSEIVGQIDLSSADVQPEIERVMSFVNTYVVPFSTFDEFPPLKITDGHFMAVKEQVAYITEVRFERQTLQYPVLKAGSTSISLENLKCLIHEVKTTASHIHSWYQSIELFGFIDLAGLATQFYLISFIRYLKTKVVNDDQLDDPILHDPNSFSFEDFDEILEGLGDIVYIFERSMEQRATTNHDDAGISIFIKIRKLLARLLLEKIEISAGLLLHWVDRAILVDSFESSQDSKISTSVFDLFSSFLSMTKVVTNSKWNSPVMNAEFCTTSMRGISQALLHYIDLILASLKSELGDADESKEVFATRKDKWFATVQNAMSTQYDAVPFNFDRHTCVKLNNIEWAQNKLKELETVIDSRKQYEVLERKRAKEFPKKTYGSDSYRFTLRIVRANDLRACDTNGLSDPYVVLWDGKKYIGKTRTIYENLDPIWDESFELEQIPDSHPTVLDLNIWDENSYTEHSLCGSTRLTLNPKDYEDFTTVEKWLAVSPKGNLLVNITTEKEEDNICYYFGKSLGRLISSESEIISMIVAKFSALITVYISKNTLNSLLGVKGYASMLTEIFTTHQQGTEGFSKLDENKVANSLDPLFDYLNSNFATLSRNLTLNLRDKVMIETWNVLLEALTMLLMPPLSEKKTAQVPLNEKELTIVRVWSESMLHFFNNGGQGIPMEDLKSVKYNAFFVALSCYYGADTDSLKQECKDRALDTVMQLITPVAGLNIKAKRTSTVLQGNRESGDASKIKSKTGSISYYQKQVDLSKSSRTYSQVDESKELESLLLRILRMRGEYEFVKRILNQKMNLAVSLNS